jgi:hypothetical protein
MGGRTKAGLPVFLAAILSSIVVTQAPDPTMAADHNDPIGVQATYRSGESGGYDVATGDPTADIADLFAWYTGPKGNPTSVVLALTWRADPLEAKEKSFDPTVKYGIHIDTDDPGLLDVGIRNDGLSIKSRLFTRAEHDIIAWYGEHKTKPGQWGMIVSGLPGVRGPIVGPVGKVLTPAPGVKVTTGLFDDPFFADLDGFFNSISVALGNQANPSLPLDRFNRVDPKTQRLTRPFGYPVGVDGFAKQNMHALVVELPASAFPSRKLHVWGTTERKENLPRSNNELRCSYDAEKGTYACKKGGR